MEYSIEEIANLLQGEVVGDKDIKVNGVSQIEDAKSNHLCFISNPKYAHFLETTKAGAVIVGTDFTDIPEGKTVIRHAMPYVAFCQALIHYFDYRSPHSGIHPSAVIDTTAEINEDVYIGPNVYIGQRVKLGKGCRVYANSSIYEDSVIGDNTTIYANVSIYYGSQIGEACMIHSGTVIGSDGFGHAPMPDGTYVKIPQIGNVVIHDNVEIGSNCSIDRANMGSTVIGEGCRIDNLIQIAHGVEIGKHTVVAAQTGISGSTKIGDHVVIAGQVGIVGHITIANKVQIGAQSGVSNNIKEEGGKYTDSPHLPLRDSIRSRVIYRKLPEIDERLRKIEKQLNNSK